MAKPIRRLPAPVPEVVTAAEAAALLRVSESTIARAVKDGRLPFFALGRRRLLPRDVLLARAFGHQPATLPSRDGGAGGQTAQVPRQEEAGEGDA